MNDRPPSSSDPGGLRCSHCAETHPVDYTHCPRTGKPLHSGQALIGRTIAGRYRVLSLLGEGGMGAVYLAEHIAIGRKVAIKRLHPELASDVKAVQRFHREARAAASTGHENIVEVLDLGQAEDGAPFIVMEHVRGQSLSYLLKKEGRLPATRACHIVGQLLGALSAVHRHGIVHRDLKPDNILLTRRGSTPDYVKVLDFGISKVRGDEGEALNLTRTGVMLGTPFYMSPEQARGLKSLDHRVDLYAAGVILYECLTGRVPFEGDNYHALLQQILRTEPQPPSWLAPGIDPKLEAIVMRSIHKEPDKRYPNADAMVAALVPFGAVALGSIPPPELVTHSAPSLAGVQPTTPMEPAVLDSRLDAVRADAAAATESLTSGSLSSGSLSSGPLASFSVGTPLSGASPMGTAPTQLTPSSALDASISRMPRAAAAPLPRVEVRSAVRPPERRAPVGSSTPSAAASAAATPATAKSADGSGSFARSGTPRPIDGPPRYYFAASDDWDPERGRLLVVSGSDPTRAPIARDAPLEPPTRASLPSMGDAGRAEAARASTPGSPSASAPGFALAIHDVQVKGSFAVAAVDHLESTASGSMDRIRAALGPALDERLRGVILPMAWLPVQVLEGLLKGAERVLGTGDGAIAVAIGRAIAERELPTTHRLFVQTATPSSAVERIPHLHRGYHARSDARLVDSSPGAARVEVESAAPENYLHVCVLAGFWQRMLELTGARDVRAVVLGCRGRGDERTLVQLRWR